MARKRYTAEQSIGKLRQAEVVSICRLRALPEQSPELSSAGPILAITACCAAQPSTVLPVAGLSGRPMFLNRGESGR